MIVCFARTAQPKTDPNDCKLIFEKGKAIEHEFAGFFTGTTVCAIEGCVSVFSLEYFVLHNMFCSCS